MNEKLAELRNKFGTMARNSKAVLLVFLVGIGLMYFGQKSKIQQSEIEEGIEQKQEASFDLKEFEEQVGMTLTNIQGAGRVQVVLSLRASEESVYAADIRRSDGELRNGGDYESNLTVVNDRTSGENPILVKTYYPEFRGALVVCDGADQPEVQSRIVKAVQAVCGLNAEEISIEKMRS